MVTNPYFQPYPKETTSEQTLVEDLVVEAIEIYGQNCYFIPRESWSEQDFLYGEDISSKFTQAFKVEMYLNDREWFGGPGDFFSKFGMEIKDTNNFVSSARGFRRAIPEEIRFHPQEGDLIYVPSQYKLWEIKFVEQNIMYYTLGKRIPYVYEMRCELWRYSHEDIDTGEEEVDILENTFAYTIKLNLVNGGGDFYIGEMVETANNAAFGEVSNWYPQNNIIEIINTNKVFVEGDIIEGSASGASWTIQTVSDRDNNTFYDRTDAQDIQTEANTFINRAEIDPFLGKP